MARVSMFVGHFALGFAAKRVAPRVSLAVLCAATQVADLLWPVFVAIGIEQVRIDPGNTAVTPLDFVSYPYSHSLVTLAVWGIVFAAAYTVRLQGLSPVWRRALALRSRSPGELRHDSVVSGFRRTLVIIAALVVSHWILDVVTHRPDMPLYPGGPKFGLGLWNSVGGTIAVEVPMYVAGLWLYLRATRARDRQGRWGFWILAVFLLIVYFANITGPPPPSVTAIWIAGAAGGAIILLWTWWVDRRRDVILAPN